MNIALTLSPEHETHDGHHCQYCTVRDCLTAKRVAIFQIVQIEPGVVQYRTMDRRSMPPDFTFDDAIKLAMVDEHQRRAQLRPPTVKRLPVPEPIKPAPVSRHIRPMHLPADRGYRRPPVTAPPMRRLLCDRLRERAARKAVA